MFGILNNPCFWKGHPWDKWQSEDTFTTFFRGNDGSRYPVTKGEVLRRECSRCGKVAFKRVYKT